MVYYDLTCDKCDITYEGEFLSFDEYKRQMDAKELKCDDCGELLRREFNAGIAIPDSFRAIESSDGGTFDFAKHTMSRAKRPSGRSKVYY